MSFIGRKVPKRQKKRKTRNEIRKSATSFFHGAYVTPLVVIESFVRFVSPKFCYTLTVLQVSSHWRNFDANASYLGYLVWVSMGYPVEYLWGTCCCSKIIRLKNDSLLKSTLKYHLLISLTNRILYACIICDAIAIKTDFFKIWPLVLPVVQNRPSVVLKYNDFDFFF